MIDIVHNAKASNSHRLSDNEPINPGKQSPESWLRLEPPGSVQRSLVPDFSWPDGTTTETSTTA